VRILSLTAAALGRIDSFIGEVPTCLAVPPRRIVADAIVRSIAPNAVVRRIAPNAIVRRISPCAVVAGNAAVSSLGDTSTVTGIVAANSAAACLSGAAAHSFVAGSLAVAAVAAVRMDIAAAVAVDVGVKLVRLPRPFVHIVAERLGLHGLLVCLLAQPGRIHLGLFRISPGTRSFRFALPGVKILHLGLAADFRCLGPLFVITLLLDSLPAPSARQQQQHNQHHHNDADYHPNPWSCFHTTHHFPLDVTGPACAFPADSAGTVYNSLSKGTYLLLVIMLIILRPVLLVLDQQPAFLERESEDDREPMARGSRHDGSAGLYRNSG
jgi:hypothetical protein